MAKSKNPLISTHANAVDSSNLHRHCRSRFGKTQQSLGEQTMTTADRTLPPLAGAGILDRERIIAAAGFNRWLVPPAALCIHLCIGMAYGFSVFWLPLSRA